ncbi:dCTP deaminase [Coprothermobacteraceae bacterium]|nr:dCTP deaminase [Coprothermobacteraceae bacterium]
MVLSDKTIKKLLSEGVLSVEPLDWSQIQPASLDLRLGRTFLVVEGTSCAFVDPRRRDTLKYRQIECADDEPLILQPGLFLLGTTIERVRLPQNIVARVEGRSSLGRMGILIHATAGYVDPGFEGNITLEISNVNHVPVAVYPGMRICQISFELLDQPCEVSYGVKGKYQGQQGPTGSRIYTEFSQEG